MMRSAQNSRIWLTTNALAWIVTNALGVSAYLYFASRTWIEPSLRGENVAREGDAVVWFGTAFPVAFAFLIADLVMLALAIRTGRKTKNWSLLFIALAIGFGWALALIVDIQNRF